MKLSYFVTSVCAAVLLTGGAWAQDYNKPTHLSNEGNQAVNTVKARGYLERQGSEDGYQQLNDQTVVNFGSSKAGTCNMNVGGTAAGPNGKDTVVTAKNIINLCQ
jgi:hypothetical protein